MQVRGSTTPVEEQAYILRHSRSSGLVIQDSASLQRLLPHISGDSGGNGSGPGGNGSGAENGSGSGGNGSGADHAHQCRPVRAAAASAKDTGILCAQKIPVLSFVVVL